MNSKLEDLKLNIINDYNNGNSIKYLSKKYNTCQTSIYNFLLKNDVKIRGPKGTKSKLWKFKKEIIKMYKNEYSCIDIAKKFSSNHSSINRFLRKNGIKIRDYQTKKERKKRSFATKGKKSINWKGGKTIIHQKIRNLFEYRQWRCDVFQRDLFTCQICGQKGKKLNAHHIKELNIIIN